jgi:hypothetical protein
MTTHNINIADDLEDLAADLADHGKLSSVINTALREYKKDMTATYGSPDSQNPQEVIYTWDQIKTMDCNAFNTFDSSVLIKCGLILTQEDIKTYIRIYQAATSASNYETKILAQGLCRVLAVHLKVSNEEYERWKLDIDNMFKPFTPKEKEAAPEKEDI